MIGAKRARRQASKVLVTVAVFMLSGVTFAERQNIEGLIIRAQPRTPEQIAAFYAARGFPPAAIEALTKTCFITVTIVNERQEVVWLELDNFRFVDAKGRALPRIARKQWQARWETLALPAAKRATFGWTQLPERRDLQPGEPVGGNVTIQAPQGRFTLEARFRLGETPGRVLQARIPDLVCPDSGEGEH